MQHLREKIVQRNPSTLSDFFGLSKELQDELARRPVAGEKRIRIALLCSFTAKGFAETLFVKCCEFGIVPEMYVGDYNQYSQEILNPESGLYAFGADVIFIFLDVRTVLGEYFFTPYSLSDADRARWAEGKIAEIDGLVRAIKRISPAKIILHNFEVPHHSPLGIIENKQDFGLAESIEKINFELRRAYKKDSHVFLFDFNAFASYIGKANLFEYKMYYLADVRVDWQHIPKLCEAYLAYIKPAVSASKKCIVLDLDNTLWGGVVGEDGLEGIQIGPTPEGRPFWEFQKHLLSFFQRGIILAVSSKNNYDDAIKVFREHPDMILREEHFAALRVNWNDKVSHLKSIAAEINIGMDSLVFFDDDTLNREIVKSELPEVLVVDVPEDPSLYSQILLDLNDFHSWQLTEEDKEKGRMYAEQRSREEFKSAVVDVAEYLKGLKMEIELTEMNDFNLPRLAQLTQKTNQFNLTTRRYTEEDLRRFAARGDFIIAARVKDKFGDNGIAGMAIARGDGANWELDSFLLSCRVIGRKVEEVMLNYIFKKAREAGAELLRAQYVPTQKNAPAKDFYKKNHFDFVGRDGETEHWEYPLERPFSAPAYIQVIVP